MHRRDVLLIAGQRGCAAQVPYEPVVHLPVAPSPGSGTQAPRGRTTAGLCGAMIEIRRAREHSSQAIA